MKSPEWKLFQDYVAERLKDIDLYARSSKGSGNSGEIADIQNKYLIAECKCESKKSVYNEKYMQKVIEEVPLHSQRLAVLFTKNQDGKMRAHLDLDTFLDLFVEYIQLRRHHA